MFSSTGISQRIIYLENKEGRGWVFIFWVKLFPKRRSMPVKLRRERCLRRLSRWTPLIGDHHKNYLIIIIIINIVILLIILVIIIVILFDTETVPQLSAMSAPTAYQALTSHLLLIRFDIIIQSKQSSCESHIDPHWSETAQSQSQSTAKVTLHKSKHVVKSYN